MTNDEIRELISQARKSSDSLRNAPWGIDRESFADGVDRLADALEGTLTEPEWEYRIRSHYVPNKITAYGAVMDQETAEAIMAWQDDGIERTLQKRVAPGTWLEVPDV